jgi:hypothetical protein
MKRFFLFTLTTFLFSYGSAQNQFDNSAIPLKVNGAPTFGKDIIINDQPDQDQRTIAFSSANNGWLYAAYTYISPLDGSCIMVMRSIDNGITWSLLTKIIAGKANLHFSKLVLLAVGNDATNMKVYLGGIFKNIWQEYNTAYVTRYDGVTGEVEDNIYGMLGYFRDLAIACDNPWSTNGATNYSIAILNSENAVGVSDSLRILFSGNGGTSVDFRKGIRKINKYISNVSVAYGRSSSLNSGRYFIAWEEKTDSASPTGHIFTSHSEPNFNSNFTRPICLDSLDASLIGKCRNPVISCQASSTDNDSTNLTEVILFEKYPASQNSSDIVGFFNQQAVGSNYFKPLTVAASSHVEKQPCITYNYKTERFAVTYFDSTNQKLPYLVEDRNIPQPNNWTIINSGYNDESNLVNPSPQISLNPVEEECAFNWTKSGSRGNGITMSDAEYSTYTDVWEIPANSSDEMHVYPNPCHNTANIKLNLMNGGKVKLCIISLLGETEILLSDRECKKGINYIPVDVATLQPGSYYCIVKSCDKIFSKPIVKSNK